MASANVSTGRSVSQFLRDVQTWNSVEMAFGNYIRPRPDLDEANLDSYRTEWVKILREMKNQHEQNAALSQFANAMALQQSVMALRRMTGILEGSVNENVVTAMQVVNAVLSPDVLDCRLERSWTATFSLVRRIIDRVDYKGVREIMKICFDRVASMPKEGNEPQIREARDLVQHIFDRKAALLPGYFIVNEILKVFPGQWPHSSFSGIFANFLESSRPTAQLVSTLNRVSMKPVVEQSGRAHESWVWRLDPTTLLFLLKENLTLDKILPFDRELTEPQNDLLLSVLWMPCSREMVYSMLKLQRVVRKDVGPSTELTYHKPLETQLVQLLIRFMGHYEKLTGEEREIAQRNLCEHFFNFTFFSNLRFRSFTEAILNEVYKWQVNKQRDILMWALLQALPVTIKSPPDEFNSLMELFKLYDEETPLDLPDLSRPDCVKQLAASSIFIIMENKFLRDNASLKKLVPVALKKHHEFLTSCTKESFDLNDALTTKPFSIPAFLNAYSTHPDVIKRLSGALIKAIAGGEPDETKTVEMPHPAPPASAPSEPLSMEMVDALTGITFERILQSKISFLSSIGNRIIQKPSILPSPAMIETYCRLCLPREVDNFGLKGIYSSLQQVKAESLGVLHCILEMFSFRLPYAEPYYRLLLLTDLQRFETYATSIKNPQMISTVESTALRLLTGLTNPEILPPKGIAFPPIRDQKKMTITVGDTEELNKVTILSLARAVKVYGLDTASKQSVKDLVVSIIQRTPHSWPSHTLQHFPPVLRELYKDAPQPRVNKAELEKKVKEAYDAWMSSDDNDKLHHLTTRRGENLFYCVLWKTLVETDDIPPVAYKVLEGIGPKQSPVQLRNFCDFLVCEFSKRAGSEHVNKCLDATNNFMWKHHIVPLDRLIFYLALRSNEGNEAQVCFFIIQLLLLKPTEFRSRVSEVVKTLPANAHRVQDFHEKHLNFHKKFPEKFFPDDNTGTRAPGEPTGPQPLPVYFGNVCLRFIPVFDVIIHRFLEMSKARKSLVTLMDHLGHLYKFHHRPITFLYNTLHYYEKKLRRKPRLKKKLVSRIIGALSKIRPEGWCFSREFELYLDSDDDDDDKEKDKDRDKDKDKEKEKEREKEKDKDDDEDEDEEERLSWTPSPPYFTTVLARLSQAVMGITTFENLDWRFNEFPNEGAHALYVSSIEMLTLPFEPAQVCTKILDVILSSRSSVPRLQIPNIINATGILISNLPEAYWDGLNSLLTSTLSSEPLSQWNLPMDPFTVFRVAHGTNNLDEPAEPVSLLLALAHSVFHHAGIAQLQTLPELVREKFLPIVKTEEQLIFVLNLTAPFLQRLHNERCMRLLFDLAVQYYRMLHKVDRECEELRYIDCFCDILYHVKYQFTGDSVKQEAEKYVREMSPPLQARLRFIAPSIANQS